MSAPPSPRSPQPPRLPTLVIGGYLGAGKTTLLNHLLRHAKGRRLAVLVNDFGEINIDAALIEARDGPVLSLAGGCICCAVGADLVGALQSLSQHTTPPDLVLIETSGVALPAAAARAARLVPAVRLLGQVVLADAARLQTQAADRYVGDTVLAQLAQAHCLVLNKTDTLRDPAQLPRLIDWLAAHAPQARVLPCTQGQLAPELLLDWSDLSWLDPAPAAAIDGDANTDTNADTDTDTGGGAASAGAAGIGLGFDTSAAAAGKPTKPGYGLKRAPPLSTMPGTAPDTPPSTAPSTTPNAAPADQVFVSGSLSLPKAMPALALAQLLAQPRWALVRAKALFDDPQGQRWLLQHLGAHYDLSPAPAAASGATTVAPGLAYIGLRQALGQAPADWRAQLELAVLALAPNAA